MWEESKESPPVLKTGLTTGVCATACSVVCAEFILSGQVLRSVDVVLPAGKSVKMSIEFSQKISRDSINQSTEHNKNTENSLTVSTQGYRAGTIKDGGDDPDATHGATVFCDLFLVDKPGIKFKAAKGVGTVTRPGLKLDVGEPAINPVPRKMIVDHLNAVAKKYAYNGGFEVAVGVENGEVIAQKTMNGRLGILGGLSILGTTGIVRPFSCAAWIASIYQGIDVAKASGFAHIAATTGNSSEQAIKKQYQLPDMALIEMGDFAGAVLKHMKKNPVEKLTICGGFGKMSKLANGHLNLNSSSSKIDFLHIAQMAEMAGANSALQQRVRYSNTSIEALGLCNDENVDLASVVCELALAKASSIVPESVELEVWAINSKGKFVGFASRP